MNKRRLWYLARRALHDGGIYGRQKLRDFVLPDFTSEELASRASQAPLVRLVDSYRRHGHRAADLDPLKLTPRPPVKALDPRRYGFALDFELGAEYISDVLPPPSIADTKHEYDPTGIFYAAKRQPWTIQTITERLQEVYCRALGFEFMHMPNKHEREWIAKSLETLHAAPFTQMQQRAFWELLEASEAFDGFLQRRFPNVKRYGLQGAESMLIALQRIFTTGSNDGITEAVISIAHRGRLNVLVQLLQLDFRLLVRKMRGNSELPEDLLAKGFIGDVLSHLYASPTLSPDAHDLAAPLTVHLLPNPSFLEAVNPVGMGLARALQVQAKDAAPKQELGDTVLNICIHGDAAWAGQGVVAETLNMQSLPHYSVGGTLHLVTNNQLGFTTPAEQGRSGFYATDLAKAISAPIIHVNSDYPEDVARAAELAMRYRKQFRKDVVIDLICYRRLGHNELDQPLLTNARLYNAIKDLKPVAQLYQEQLLQHGVLDADKVAAYRAKVNERYEQATQAAESYQPIYPPLAHGWDKFNFPAQIECTPDTGVSKEDLVQVAKASVQTGQLNVFPRLDKTHFNKRLEALQQGEGIDFATAEALAMGSLMLDGFHVRLSGQDCGRGTFSQRHALLADQREERAFVPLNSLQSKGRLEVANSPLSEFAVLGFEQGVAWSSPEVLPIWEAQFGDFNTGAQIIIDTFVASGESKWGKQSALTLLLPHGADPGAGPEHSSARIERFLQLSNEPLLRQSYNPNMHMCLPSTPAQLFHLLRRQMVRNYRKPLIVFTPKSILRLPAATSNLQDFLPGRTWQPVIHDEMAASAKRIVFVSGQLYYKLRKAREEQGLTDSVGFVRIEELSPFPYEQLEPLVAKQERDVQYIYASEEPENAGALQFVVPRIQQLLGPGKKLDVVSRRPMAAPAHGISKESKKEEAELIEAVFAGLV